MEPLYNGAMSFVAQGVYMSELGFHFFKSTCLMCYVKF